MGDYRDYIVKGKKDPRMQSASSSPDIFSGVANFAGGVGNTLMDMSSNLASGASKALIDVSSSIMNPMQGLQNIYNAGEQVVKGTGDIAGGIYDSAMGLAQGNLNKSGEGVLRSIKGATNVGTAPGRLLPGVGNYMGNMGEGFTAGIKEGIQGASDIGQGLYGMGSTLFTNPGSTKGLDYMNQVVHGASGLINAPFVAGMSSLPQGAQEGVGKVFAPAMNNVSATYDDLIQRTGADPKSKEAQRLKTALNDVFNVGSVVFPMANAGKIVKGAQEAGTAFSKVPEAFGKGLSAGGKELTKGVTGVSFDDVAFNYKNPEIAGKVASGKITPESTFGKITGKLGDLRKDQYGLGKQYEGVINKAPDFKLDHTPIVDFTKNRLKLEFSPEEGFMKTRNTLISDAEIGKLNTLFKDKILYEDFTGANFKSTRDALGKIAKFDGSPASSDFSKYAKTAYGEFNNLYRKNVPGMEAIDAQFSKAKELFKPLQEEFLKKTSKGWEIKKSINEDTITRIFTNKTKRTALTALEREVPGITKELEALVVHKNIEKANTFNTPGAYVRAGTIMGGAAASLSTLNPFPLLGSLLTNPSIVTAGARKLGKLFGEGKTSMKPPVGGAAFEESASFTRPTPGAGPSGESASFTRPTMKSEPVVNSQSTGFPQLQSPIQQKLLGAPSTVYAKGPAIRMREKTPNANLTDVPQINPNGTSFTPSQATQRIPSSKSTASEVLGKEFTPVIDESLTSLEKVQSRKAQEYANANYSTIREKYLAKNGVPDENGGYKSITINTDDFRDYLNDGPDKKAYTGTNAHVGHEAASLLSNALYKEALIMQQGKGNKTILTLAGGGSGKGSASKMFVDQSQYPLVLDQVFGNYEKGMNKLRDAEKSYGYNKEIMFIDRDPTDAFLNGVVPRAVKLGKNGKLPRTVNVNLASGDNINSRKAVITALKNDPDAIIRVVDNNKGDGFARLITDRKQALEYLEGLVYDKATLQKDLYTALKKKYGIEKIPDNIALGLGLKTSDLRRSIQPKLKL